jgi:transposase
LAAAIHQLCKLMTVSDVARHFELDWKTVKDIDKQHLEAQYGQPELNGLRLLAVDEIAIRKGHSYLTVVLNYETGQVVYVGKERKFRTLNRFFKQLTGKQRKSIDAVAMDMWDPYIKAVKKNLPQAKIVFDLFHVVAAFGRVIDKIRTSECRKAAAQHKEVFKGSKYLLLKNRTNVRRKKQRRQLKKLLKLNEVINTVMILKEQLKHIWSYCSRTWAGKALDQWCDLARSVNHPKLNPSVA